MAAEKEGSAKCEGNKKADDSGGGSSVAVFEIDMDCEGCAKKVKRVAKCMEGVESVKTSAASNKLTVTGKVDPTQIKSRLEKKTKKKVEIISPQPKKDGGGGCGDKKADEKSDNKPAEEKKTVESKPPKESTVVLKIRLHCEVSISEIKRVIREIDGVNSVEVDETKDLATKTMEVKELAPYLEDKLKRNMEVVQPKKEEEEKDKGGGGEKKEKRNDGGGGEAKAEKNDGEKNADGGEGSGTKVEANEMENHEYAAVATSYWNDASYGNYTNRGYQGNVMDPHAPQIFSDENPNACSLM